MIFIKDLSWLVGILFFTSTILSILSAVSSIMAYEQNNLIKDKTDEDNNKNMYLIISICLSFAILFFNLFILYRIYKYYGKDRYRKGDLFDKKEETKTETLEEIKEKIENEANRRIEEANQRIEEANSRAINAEQIVET